jgi:SH3 domain protein
MFLKKLLTDSFFWTQNRIRKKGGGAGIRDGIIAELPHLYGRIGGLCTTFNPGSKGMRRIIWSGFFLLFFSSVLQAKTMYVNDVIKITLRTGPGISHKVIEMLESGQAVDVMETSKDWVHVRLPDGRDGWVLTRFLTSKMPDDIQLNLIQEKQDKMTKQLADLKEENERLKLENQKQIAESANEKKELESLTKSYNTLVTESKDFLKMKADYENAAREAAEQTDRANTLQSRLASLEWRQNVAYFLSGGLLFLIGFLIGSSSERRKRQQTNYFY